MARRSRHRIFPREFLNIFSQEKCEPMHFPFQPVKKLCEGGSSKQSPAACTSRSVFSGTQAKKRSSSVPKFADFQVSAASFFDENRRFSSSMSKFFLTRRRGEPPRFPIFVGEFLSLQSAYPHRNVCAIIPGDKSRIYFYPSAL